ncbi:MAG: molybdopterin-synthase adenylyltransferase MoeB, partial [Anaerolineae bacterium]|nr:molybdopterin-synthase adenylyltransferase MoeB [Anaerolineae bacterium]
VVLSKDEITRYARHLILPQVGYAGQRKLKTARVLIVGTGGLGSPVALYLAAAGIGTIGLVDFDVVDATNLQRQIVHSESTVGVPKVESAAARLRDLNPYITINTYSEPFTSQNALDILAQYDLVVDGTDNFPTRYLLNDAAVMLNKPMVYGSIYRFEGQVSIFGTKEGPCYRCLLPDPPPPHLVQSCAEAGVLGILPGTIGTLQATEAIKLILGEGEPLIGRLLLYDALDMSFDLITLPKRPNCPMCGESPTITTLIDYEDYCGMPAHADSEFQQGRLHNANVPEMTVQQINERIAAGEKIVLVDVREAGEVNISRIPGALHIPMSQLDQRQDEIPRDQPVVMFCRAGIRSLKAIQTLQAAGSDNLTNMIGGITAWAQEIDPSIPLY